MNLGVVVGVECLVVYCELRLYFVTELGGGVDPVGNSFEFKVRRETDKTSIGGMRLKFLLAKTYSMFCETCQY